MPTNSVHFRFLSCLVLGICATSCSPAYKPPAAESTDLALARFEQSTITPKEIGRTLSDEAAMIMTIREKLQPAAQDLCQQNNRERCMFRIRLIDDLNTINATASGKSQINIYRGLIRVMPGEAELAFIVAHEMGHHIANHLNEQEFHADLAGSVGSMAFGLAGFLVGADMAAVKGAMRDGGETGSTLAYSMFSLSQENEADYIGAYLMARAGYDARAAFRAIDYLAALTPGSGPPAFFQTHPGDDQRSARLRRATIEIRKKQSMGRDLLPDGL